MTTETHLPKSVFANAKDTARERPLRLRSLANFPFNPCRDLAQDTWKFLHTQAYVVVLVVLFALAASTAANAVSFSCDNARTGTEQAICHDLALGRLDDELAVTYKKARLEAVSRGQSDVDIRSAQREWMADREKCASEPRCLETQYRSRLDQLRAAPPRDQSGTDTSDGSSQTSVSEEGSIDGPEEGLDASGTVPEPIPPSSIQASSKPEPSAPKATDPAGTEEGPIWAWILSLGTAFLVAMGILYMVPSMISFLRGHHYRWVILIVNVLAGWTGLGWIGLLVWSVWPRNSRLMSPLYDDATRVSQHLSSLSDTASPDFKVDGRDKRAPESTNESNNISIKKFIASDYLSAALGSGEIYYKAKFSGLAIRGGIVDYSLEDPRVTLKLANARSWNWAGFLFGPYWGLYRGVPYSWTILLLFASFLAISGFYTLPRAMEYGPAIGLSAIFALNGNGWLLYKLIKANGQGNPPSKSASSWSRAAIGLLLALVAAVLPIAVESAK